MKDDKIEGLDKLEKYFDVEVDEEIGTLLISKSKDFTKHFLSLIYNIDEGKLFCKDTSKPVLCRECEVQITLQNYGAFLPVFDKMTPYCDSILCMCIGFTDREMSKKEEDKEEMKRLQRELI